MTIFIVLIGVLIFSIIFTVIQMKLQLRKERDNLNKLFDDVSLERE